MLRIDAHHHLWTWQPAEFAWLEGDLSVLRKDYLLPDLLPEMKRAEVSGSIVVQARQTLEETDWLLKLAAQNPALLGVVGWLPLQDSQLPELLGLYARQTSLSGIRHVVQAEPDGFLDSPAFNVGIAALQGSGLVYDLLIFERQLDEATRFVDRHPNQVFVLDHLGKPRIAAQQIQPWAQHMRELARRENVVCKLSGMVTEADSTHWSPKDLKPYFEIALDCFSPARLMAGSDWPVLSAGCTYERWWDLLADWVGKLSLAEQEDILGQTALRTYNLSSPAESLQHRTEGNK